MVALAMASDNVRYTTIIWYNVSIGIFTCTCSFIAIMCYHLGLKVDKKFPHFLPAIKD